MGNEMKDFEISKALALAIGWREDEFEYWFHDKTLVCKGERTDGFSFREFNYLHWNVIGPIAARYGLTVCFMENIAWHPHCSPGHKGSTPQKAIALAVINGANK